MNLYHQMEKEKKIANFEASRQSRIRTLTEDEDDQDYTGSNDNNYQNY